MPKKSKEKGARFERRVAKLFNEKFTKFNLRRVPLSGGLDIKCDIYDPHNDSFPFFIECKHRESYRIGSILDGSSPLYSVLNRTIDLSAVAYQTKKYDGQLHALVIFKGGDFKEEMVMCGVYTLTSKCVLSTPTIRVKERSVCRLYDFLWSCDTSPLKLKIITEDDDGEY